MSISKKRVLIIRFSSIGDIVLVSGIIRFMLDTISDVQIDVLTFTAFKQLWQNVDNIYSVDKGISLKEYKKYLETVPEYDYIFDLHANTRSRIASSKLHGKTFRYQKQSFCRRLFVKFRLCRKSLTEHVVQKYAAPICDAFSLPLPDLERLRPYYKNEKKAVKNKIVIHPFASKHTKYWLNSSKLALMLADAGYNVYIIGEGEQDTPNDERIKRVHTKTLGELIEFMADAEAVVSTDSGPLHIACALSRRTYAIFCSTSKELGFYPSFERCTVFEEELLCRPCHLHGRDICPSKNLFERCMHYPAEEVFKAIVKDKEML